MGESGVGDTFVRDVGEEHIIMTRIKDYFNDNLDNPDLSMADVSLHLNMSKAQMYRKVKEVSSLTPNELLQKMRLTKAEELLKSDARLTVSEVAYSVGFTSPSYFTKCYKEMFGMLPREHR